jgi:DNA-directed RNA polymerase specialized sigma24 family protein
MTYASTPIPYHVNATEGPCGRAGCARRCTQEGLTAPREGYARMLARARRVVVDPHLAEEVVQDGTAPCRQHRERVVEVILRGRPYDAVASDLDVPAGTLRTRVHYRLRALRDALTEQDAA